MRRLSLFLTLIVASLLTMSCNKGGDSRSAPVYSVFVPGECLNSAQLEFTGQNETDLDGVRVLVLGFELDVGGTLKKAQFRSVFCPAQSVFDTFGESSKAVSNAYEEVSGNLPDLYFASSIFYEDGISLRADNEFAGITAGKNIADGAISYQQWRTGKNKVAVIIDSFSPTETVFPNFVKVDDAFNANMADNLFINGSSFALFVPTYTFREIDEDVTFVLEVPVKVGLYLTWLYDKLTDPDAQLSFRDETLTCHFTIHKGLR